MAEGISFPLPRSLFVRRRAMAWCTLSFQSKTLKRPEKLELLIPQAGFKGLTQKEDYGVLVLLHGLHKDRKEWLLDSQMPFLVRELPLLVVMPTCRNAFYVNTANGYAYMDYITKEIPSLIRAMFPVSPDPRRWTVMGESMGGYGSLVCGLHHPEVFGGIAAFSPVTDISKAPALLPDVCFEDVFGSREEAVQKGFDLFGLAEQLKEAPPVRMCCGKSDPLLDMNRRFYEKIRSFPDVAYSEGEGGHDFLYWNPMIPEVLSWIMKRMEAGS